MINDPRFTTPYPQFASDSEVSRLSACIIMLLLTYNIVSVGLVDFDPRTATAYSRQPVHSGSEQMPEVAVQYAMGI